MPRNHKKKLKLQLITKAALIRLSVLLSLLTVLIIWAWTTMIWMPETSYKGELPPPSPETIILKNRLQEDIQKIASEIGSRNVNRYDRLNATKNYLEKSLTQSGYSITPQEYKIDQKTYQNLAVEKRGTEYPNEIIIIGAHYDSAFTSPGANDNATGTAATLELAKIFATKQFKRTIRFVEFTNEEPPFFWTDQMGSSVYAKQSKQNNEKIIAMLSLETIGYFSDRPGSQQYPFPLNQIYPNQGNFISFIGNLNSSNLVKRSIGLFRKTTQFPSEGVALPSWIPGVGWSDQWSFWQQGYPGIMITDTAPYRYPHYHTADDTPDKIDFDKLARVTSGLVEVISGLAT